MNAMNGTRLLPADDAFHVLHANSHWAAFEL